MNFATRLSQFGFRKSFVASLVLSLVVILFQLTTHPRRTLNDRHNNTTNSSRCGIIWQFINVVLRHSGERRMNCKHNWRQWVNTGYNHEDFDFYCTKCLKTISVANIEDGNCTKDVEVKHE